MERKIKTWLLLIIAVSVFILNTTLFQLLRVSDTLPNIGLIIAVILTYLFGFREGMVFGVIYALLIDLYVSKFIGMNLLIYPLILVGVYYFSKKFYKGSVIAPIIILIAMTICYYFGYFILMFLLQSTIQIKDIYEKLLIEGVYNTVLGYVLFYIVFWRVQGHRLGEHND